MYAARINHPFLEIFYGKLKKLLKKISIFFLIFSKKVFKNGLLMYVQMAQINKTLESSYKTSNFNASLDLGGFLIYIYIYISILFIHPNSGLKHFSIVEIPRSRSVCGAVQF